MKNKACFASLIIALMLAHVFFAAVPAQPRSSPRTFSEKFVLRSLTQIHAAQMTYQATAGNGNFGSLQNLEQAAFIDSALGAGSKYGYTFAVSITQWIPGPPSVPASFTVTATPRVYRKTGLRSFFIDAFGEIRGGDKNGQAALVTDPIVDFDFCTSGAIPDNERCFIEVLRTLHGAETTFAATSGNGQYGSLAQLYAMNLINQRMSTGTMRGYSFSVSTTPQTGQTPAAFGIAAVPLVYGTTGIRSFFVGTDGVVRGADKNGSPANQEDPPIESNF